MSNRTLYRFATMATILAATIATVSYANPLDEVSNPEALEYADVDIAPEEMNPDFIRDGIVSDASVFAKIVAGLDEDEVRSLLGNPLSQGGREWDYNFQLKMEQSANYFVCQYKVVFDENALVEETVWRRRQCKQLAEAAAD